MGIGETEGQFDLLKAKTQHELRLEKSQGAVESVFGREGAIIGNQYFIPMGQHQATFEANAQINKAMQQLAEAKIELSEGYLIIAVVIIIVLVQIGRLA